MERVAVISFSHTNYGILKDDTPQLLRRATEECLSRVDKGIDPKEVDLVITSCADNQFSNQHQTGALALRYLGNQEAEAFRVEAACASGGLAVYLARKMLMAGYVDNALIVGFEKMSRLSTANVTSVLIRGGSPEENRMGVTQPAAYAMMAQIYMEKYGATEDDYAQVSVKNHNNALRNPWAQFHKKITVEEVKDSRLIASPIRLLHCSPISDGAAAILLSRKPRDYTDTPVYIKGMGLAHDRLGVFERDDPTSVAASRKAAAKAFKEADVKVKDIDFAEVHDAFTPVELMIYEDLGFAGKGEGYRLIRDGTVTFEGSLPVNVSGGLKGKGHPIGATGVGMIVEVFLQLRGEAGQRQLQDVELGLAENHGGTGATSIVTIMGR
ncbi:MAG: thiolase C-terminal domain-containing protein [Candidatus Bathyarchaeia archaeon]